VTTKVGPKEVLFRQVLVYYSFYRILMFFLLASIYSTVYIAVIYLFICAVCCMHVCVSSIYVDMYGFMILNHYVLFYMCCMLQACYVMYVLFNV
jgi:hypothetical protein